ncbi:Imm50 family immunity protein [Streptomyces sp. NPDC056524]|uniref:Imm50 family immunity protein n=1 Tax=Streptomyces sp. NPDC056524 TaxID=3345851 RepID=UPI00368C7CC5
MGDSDWTSIIESAREVAGTYATPPSLNECALSYVQIDERGTSVTMGFETSVLPSSPPPAWVHLNYNVVELYVKFARVKELRITGWDSSVREASVNLSSRDDGSLRVSVETEGAHLDFIGSAPLLTRAHPFLRAED